MANFYGTIQGARKEVNTPGNKKSGLNAHIRGWDKGVKVVASVDQDGNDIFTIYQTNGSNDPSIVKKLAVI